MNTNVSGNITGWDFDLYSNPGFAYPEIYVISSTPYTYGSAEVNLPLTAPPYATAYTMYGPGVDATWAQVSVPEPTGLLPLLVLGTLGKRLLGRTRKVYSGLSLSSLDRLWAGIFRSLSLIVHQKTVDDVRRHESMWNAPLHRKFQREVTPTLSSRGPVLLMIFSPPRSDWRLCIGADGWQGIRRRC